MKTKFIILVTLIASSAHGRIGETRAEMIKTYGEPKSVTTTPVSKKVTTKTLRWTTKNMLIQGVEFEGKMISESYTLTRTKWTSQEIQSACEAQIPQRKAGNTKWKETSPTSWRFDRKAKAFVTNDGRCLTFTDWNYESLLDPHTRPADILKPH